jgi:hypothetical protein
VGQTPVIRTQISHHQGVNALGALLVTPNGRRLRLFSRLQRKNINGQHVVAFIKAAAHDQRSDCLAVG